jgi:hypothetical protein
MQLDLSLQVNPEIPSTLEERKKKEHSGPLEVYLPASQKLNNSQVVQFFHANGCPSFVPNLF